MKIPMHNQLCSHFLKDLDDLVQFLEISIGCKVDKLLSITFILDDDNEKLICDFIGDGEWKRANIKDHKEDT